MTDVVTGHKGSGVGRHQAGDAIGGYAVIACGTDCYSGDIGLLRLRGGKCCKEKHRHENCKESLHTKVFFQI